MPMYHIKMDKIRTGENKPFAWTVYNFDSMKELEEFQDRVNAVHRQMMSETNNGQISEVQV